LAVFYHGGRCRLRLWSTGLAVGLLSPCRAAQTGTCTPYEVVFSFPVKKHTGKAVEKAPNDIQIPAIAPRWVAYYRVSTAKQGASGLGLEAQTEAVTNFIAGRGGEIVASFTETESGKKASNRPALITALALCRKRRATLVFAKLDRLARNVHFISGLLESNVLFVAADQPTKDRFMLHLQAAFAEEEGRRISLRTKEALAAAKRRGVDIGATGRVLARRHKAAAKRRACALRPLFMRLSREGIHEPARLVEALNSRGVPPPSGTGMWHRPTVHRVLRRLGGALGKGHSRD
jgi:DNA invertase Pin-like site-specific DNA recombinase